MSLESPEKPELKEEDHIEDSKEEEIIENGRTSHEGLAGDRPEKKKYEHKQRCSYR